MDHMNNRDRADNMTTENMNQTDTIDENEMESAQTVSAAVNVLSSNESHSTDTTDTTDATDATDAAEAAEAAEAATSTAGSRYFFATDAQGDWADEAGNRYTAHAGVAFHTPQGLNAGCPQAASAAEAAAMKGLVYDPLKAENLETESEPAVSTAESSTDNNNHE